MELGGAPVEMTGAYGSGSRWRLGGARVEMTGYELVIEGTNTEETNT